MSAKENGLCIEILRATCYYMSNVHCMSIICKACPINEDNDDYITKLLNYTVILWIMPLLLLIINRLVNNIYGNYSFTF